MLLTIQTKTPTVRAFNIGLSINLTKFNNQHHDH